MGSLSTVTPVMSAGAAACVVAVKEEEEVLKVAPYGCVTEGVMVGVMKACDYGVMTRAQGLSFWAAR